MQQPPGGPPGGGYPPPGGGGYGPPPGGYGGPPPGGFGGGPPPGGYGGGPPPGGFGGGPPPGGYGGPPPGGGYPPPDYGSPGLAPPPPPPQKGGSNVAIIILIIVVAFVVLGGGGCAVCMCVAARSASRSAQSEPPRPVQRTPTPTPTPAPAKENWITAERPYVKFLAPAGWSTEITSDKEWGIFKSPARDAVFAFTTFNHPGESTARLSRAASVLGVSNIDWGAKRAGTVGRDKFDAKVGDGSCNFNGAGGYIWYATVNTGSSDQILLIFTTTATAPKSRRSEAQAAVDSLQRR